MTKPFSDANKDHTHSSKDEHDNSQRAYFDQHASFFCQPVPENIQERTRSIAAAAHLNENSTVLDVGSGTGAMIVHMLEFGVKQSNIVACDLSAVMIENSKVRFSEVNFWQGDILDFSPEKMPNSPQVFDAIFFNACFGNIWDQDRAIEQTQQFLSKEGRIVISHPLGLKFVKALRDSIPDLVLHLLPTKAQLMQWEKEQPLRLEQFVDTSDFYLAVLQKK